MRASEILLEFDISKTVMNVGPAAIHNRVRKDRTAKEHGEMSDTAADVLNDPDAGAEVFYNRYGGLVVEKISAFDPTPNKKYSLWLVRTYMNKGIQRWEDFGRARVALRIFHEIKQRGYFKRHPETIGYADINFFKELSQLEYWVEGVAQSGEAVSNAEKDREIERQLIEDNHVTILADTSELKVVIPRTKEAAQFYGRNTRWCTSAEEDNMFNDYASSGDLYIILNKKTNRRWQLHFEDEQYMDEKDQPIQSFDDGVFPIEAFDYIDINEKPTMWRVQRLLDFDGESDEAGLPDYFLHRIMDSLDRTSLAYVFLKAVTFGGYDQTYVVFLSDYLSKRFRIKAIVPGKPITEFGRDILSFLVSVTSHKDYRDIFRHRTLSWLREFTYYDFPEKSNEAHYAFISDDGGGIAIAIANEGIRRFSTYSTKRGSEDFSDDQIKEYAKRTVHPSKTHAMIDAINYMSRFIRPEE